MSIFSLSCLWGCANASPTAAHTISEITSVSISCGEMDRSYSYSFWLHANDDTWLFDASCFTKQHEIETSLTDCVITEEETAAILAILEQNDSIAFVENYVAKHKSNNGIPDASSYGFALTFSDGAQYSADKQQKELETHFYSLAEKYANIVSDEQ